MEIRYFDGFTEDLIGFTCKVKGNNCHVEGKWFDASKDKNECQITYEKTINPSDIEALKNKLIPLKEKYDLPITDLHQHDIEFENRGKTYKRSFYGAGKWFFKEFPDLNGKLDYLLKLCDEIRSEIKKASNK